MKSVPAGEAGHAASPVMTAEQPVPYASLFKERPFDTVQIVLFAVIALVVICVVWQPFLLGFYSDDWPQIVAAAQHGAAFSKERLRFTTVITDRTRPGLFPGRFLLSSLFGDDVLLWQWGLLLCNIAVALSIVAVLRVIAQPRTRLARALTVCAALCWLLLPWNAAEKYWPAVLVNVSVLAAEGLFCIYVIRGWRTNRSRVVGATLFYLWMCLSYEAFYMQWAPLVVLGLALWKEERIALKPILTTSAGLIFAQAVAAVWYLRHADVSQRRVRLHWAIASVQNLSALVPSMFRSNEEIYAVFVVFTAAVIGFWVFAYVKSFRVPSMQPERRHMTLVSGACLLMGLTSIVIVSLGDRVVTHTGVETRSTMIFNFWIIVTAAIVTIFTFDRLHGKLRPAFAAALGGFALCLAAGQILRADDWAAAWRLQQNILRQAPVAQLQRMEPNAEVVYVNQLWLNSVPIFSDIWGLRNAMAWAYPYLNRSNFLIYSPYRGTLKWDGHRLGFTAEPIQNSEMPSAVYIWEPSEGTFEKATGPFVVGQDMVVRPTS